MKRILVVDDEQSIRDTLQMMLEGEGFTVDVASGGKEALEMCRAGGCDLVITDLKMPGIDGIQLIEDLTASGCVIPIIIMTAYATKDQAIQALNLGAAFFIEKPFKKQELMNYVNRALRMEDLIRENRSLKGAAMDAIIGNAKNVRNMKDLIRKVARTDSTVLITGESGTGKEVVARALHGVSDRADRPFVAINCAAIPSELLESELFGHVKGSFTGAVKDKSGLMETANGGTFLLDEIGSMPPSLQMKVLRAIQERVVLPVGSESPRTIDVRLIAATNEDLEAAVSRGDFRKDLYYRLNVINIHIPPLRDRRDDIELLFAHFLKLKDKAGSIRTDAVPPGLIEMLTAYDWPGNIRELENITERMVALSVDGVLDESLLPDHVRKPVVAPLVSDEPSVIPNMDDIEKAYIHWVLTQHGGQKQKAAEVLGIGRSTLDRKIEKYGLDV